MSGSRKSNTPMEFHLFNKITLCVCVCLTNARSQPS